MTASVQYLLDSTLLIDHLNGVSEAGEFLDAHGSKSVVSVITVTEVLAGSENQEVGKHELLLDQHDCLNIDGVTAKLAAALRKMHRWKLADAYQAALATRHNLKLVTRNTKDFDPKKHAFVHVPYKI